MEELIVMEGNLIAGAGAGLSKSSSMDLFPQWAPTRIIDGQSSLGMPVAVTAPSPTQGYLSGSLSMARAGDPLPATLAKWCAVDLGKPGKIERVRLLPLESEAYVKLHFPSEVPMNNPMKTEAEIWLVEDNEIFATGVQRAIDRMDGMMCGANSISCA